MLESTFLLSVLGLHLVRKFTEEKEEQDQVRQSRETDTSQEGCGWLEQTTLNYDYSLAQLDADYGSSVAEKDIQDWMLA